LRFFTRFKYSARAASIWDDRSIEFCPVRPAANRPRIDRKTIRAFDYGEAVRLFFQRRVERKPTRRSRLLATTDTAYVVTPVSRLATLCNIVYQKEPTNVPANGSPSPSFDPPVVR
jgi:hypothetical protein